MTTVRTQRSRIVYREKDREGEGGLEGLGDASLLGSREGCVIDTCTPLGDQTRQRRTFLWLTLAAPLLPSGVLAGLALQERIEREAFVMGGGGFRAPVQRAVDFLEGRLSTEPLPASSYRLGVTNARCDRIYSEEITDALRQAVALEGLVPRSPVGRGRSRKC